jgi:hypothetical protein
MARRHSERTIAVVRSGRSRFSRLRVRYPDSPARGGGRPAYDAATARELLAKTGELPASRSDLVAVLTEYRHALFALAAEPSCQDAGR